jgi:hypothetical protein
MTPPPPATPHPPPLPTRGRGGASGPQVARLATCTSLPPMWGRDGVGGPPRAKDSQDRRGEARALRLSGSYPRDPGCRLASGPKVARAAACASLPALWGKDGVGRPSRAKPSQDRRVEARALRLSGSYPREAGCRPASGPKVARAATCASLSPMWGRDGVGGPPEAEPSQDRQADTGARRLSASAPRDPGCRPASGPKVARAAACASLPPLWGKDGEGGPPWAKDSQDRRGDTGARRLSGSAPRDPDCRPASGPKVARSAACTSLPPIWGKDEEGGPPRAEPSQDRAQDGRADV